MESGIYIIKNAVNSLVYIGSAVCVRKRLGEHRRSLNHGSHKNAHLQSAWNKYGSNSFLMHQLLGCAKKDLLFYEQRCIDGFDSVVNGYNKCPVAGNTLGRKSRPEVIAAMAATKRGVKKTPEAKANHAAAMASEEVRKRISERTKGIKKPKSAAHCAALSLSQIGKKLSEETKRKLSVANIGKKNGPHSDETKKKMSESQKGRVFTEDHLANIREGQRIWQERRLVLLKRG